MEWFILKYVLFFANFVLLFHVVLVVVILYVFLFFCVLCVVFAKTVRCNYYIPNDVWHSKCNAALFVFQCTAFVWQGACDVREGADLPQPREAELGQGLPPDTGASEAPPDPRAESGECYI